MTDPVALLLGLPVDGFLALGTMDQYESVKKLGSGNFGVTHLMKHKESGETVAVKQIPRGSKINKNVYREVLNHRKLSHPNVIGFKEVLLDDKYLNIVMEYASGAPLVRAGCDLQSSGWQCTAAVGIGHPEGLKLPQQLVIPVCTLPLARARTVCPLRV